MIAKITIKKVVNKLAKNGITKLCSIKTLDKNGTDFWLNGFGNNTTENWKEGQIVELDCYEEEYNGRKSWRFKTPEDVSIIEILKEINTKLDWLCAKKEPVQYPEPPQGQPVPETEIKPEDIPF